MSGSKGLKTGPRVRTGGGDRSHGAGPAGHENYLPHTPLSSFAIIMILYDKTNAKIMKIMSLLCVTNWLIFNEIKIKNIRELHYF
jgi:hypothetical protein